MAIGDMLISSHERDHARGEKMTRITVPLSDEERSALAQMASQEMRDPRAQIRWILREAAERQGIWPPALLSEKPVSHEVMT